MEQTFDTDRLTGDWISHSSPAPGRNFTVLAEGLGSVVRRMNEQAAETLLNPGALARTLAPRIAGLGSSDSAVDSTTLTSRALVGMWLSGYALGFLGPKDSLSTAERWFTGGSRSLPRLAGRNARIDSPELPAPEVVFALLPYLLDPLAPGTRRSTMRRPEESADRRSRKERGVFYTPGDVAAHMAVTATERGISTCLDPCCGTGVFLRAALLTGRCDFEGLFGIDIDPLAADACAFVLATAAIAKMDSWPTPWAAWHSARSRLATADSLQLMARDEGVVEPETRLRQFERLSRRLRAGEFPSPAEPQSVAADVAQVFPQLREGADLVISNPPYAQLGPRPLFGGLGSNFSTLGAEGARPATRLEGLFVELAWRLISERGVFSLVLPLSIATNSSTQFVEVRKGLQALRGELQVSFFDRAPDALFGDDVKTRNTIVRFRAGRPQGLSTSGLLRWTSGTRRGFFSSIEHCVVGAQVASYIPKIGSPAEARLLARLSALPSCLGAASERVSALTLARGQDSQSEAVFVGPTAYNWLSCSRSTTTLFGEGHSSESQLTAMEFATPQLADATFAILASRVTFWLWRVEGDGFHVTRRFLTRLPFAVHLLPSRVLSELACVGRELWAAAERRPIVSINKGRRTVSFSSLADPDLVDRADASIARAFGFEEALDAIAIRRWHENLVVVDFERRDRAALVGKGDVLAA